MGGANALCESTAGKIVFFLFSLLIDFYGENQVEIVSQVAKVFCYGPGSSEGILKIHSM